jgi:hypothetical protein
MNPLRRKTKVLASAREDSIQPDKVEAFCRLLAWYRPYQFDRSCIAQRTHLSVEINRPEGASYTSPGQRPGNGFS